MRSLPVVLAISAMSTVPALAAQPLTDCWKASYTHEVSGRVRVQRTSIDRSHYIYSYDGDFAWVGEPTERALQSEYVFCFRERLDEGGVLFINGRMLELGRIGSVKLPQGWKDLGFSSSSSTVLRDPRDFPGLYGVFNTPGKPDSSMEIQLDRLRGTSAVVVSTTEGKRRSVTYLTGTAVRTEAPALPPQTGAKAPASERSE